MRPTLELDGTALGAFPEPQPKSVQARHGVYQTQAEPRTRSAPTAVGAMKAAQQVRELGGRNARSVVRYAEMERYFRERLQAVQTRAAEVPKELQELDARIARLRERLRRGDPDMLPDEIEAAISKAEGKRAELMDQQPAARQCAELRVVLPKAAAEYRKKIELGLEGNEAEGRKARIFLRELLGTIELKPQGRELWAEYGMQRTALLQVVGLKGLGFSGSGGVLCDVPHLPGEAWLW